MPIKRISKEMPISEALEVLEKIVDNIANIEDLDSFIENNKEEFIYMWAKVNQYYKYVIHNTDHLSEEGFRAIDIISDLAALNPSLGVWVDLMIEPKKFKNQTQTQNNARIDVSGVIEYVEAIAYEIKNMQQWDRERVHDVQLQLEEYQKMIMANKGLFEVNEYQCIMDNISSSLEKIDRFNRILKPRTNPYIRSLKR